MCHSDTSYASAKDAHVLTGLPTVTNVQPTLTAPNLVVTYNLKLDGVDATNFLVLRSAYVFDGTNRTDLLTSTALSGGTGGNYTITVTGGAIDNARYLFRVANSTDSETRINAVVVSDVGTGYVNLVSDLSCANCHGAEIEAHYGYQAGASQCVVCHNAVNVQNDPARPAPTLVGLVHGVHNSHNMPSGKYVWGTDEFSVSYPTYMTNCSVCHDDTTKLAAANGMTVSGENCFSCHESMKSWEDKFTKTGLTFHNTMTEATDCSSACHKAGGIARDTVAKFHDGLETERLGIIYGGQDLSVEDGKDFNWKITKVVDNKTTGNLEISWTTEYPKGTPVNPCATTVTATQPGWHAVSFPNNEGGLSMLRSYAQGDDYVLGQSTTAPGQALAVSLYSTGTPNPNNAALNTTCATTSPFTATSIIKRDNLPDGTRAIVALQGKPQLLVPAGMSKEHWTYTTMYIRVPTPTYEFIVGTGAPAPARRVVADTQQCLKCHVGSLYQHGNTRVDNVTMCIICHNSASSEQNIRVGMGVDKSEAYDGRVSQTYEFKTMLHAIHSAGDDHSPFVIYRNRGIYAWVPEGVTPPNWATGAACDAPSVTGVDTLGNIVFGSDPASTNKCQQHNLYHPTYPRALNDCAACHKADFQLMVDQTKGVATTLDAGGTTWNNQVDDTLQGANTAACTSCHQDAPAVGHATQNGWTPSVFPNGRQTIIDAAK